jgi:Protein of unknown function (DUF1997)
MQAQPTDPTNSSYAPPLSIAPVSDPVQFKSQYIDCMEMYADAAIVAEYLDHHSQWFGRCAEPMTVEPVGSTGYVLVIGRYGSFGFELEPKIGLNLLPGDENVYRIETIPVPNYTPQGYDVDFKAAMELVEHDRSLDDDDGDAPLRMTRVQWQLDLTVSIQFPKFIQALPANLIHGTGETLLKQIVRQVSRRLTHKVQEDFHTSRNLVMPKQARKWFFQ